MISSVRSRSSILVDSCSDNTKIQESEKSFATLNPQEVDHRLDFNKAKKADSLGTPTEDWSDVKHDERKKRDRVLPDGVVMKLIKKSDYKGFERMLTNISLMLLNAFLLKKLDIFSYPFDLSTITYEKVIAFIPLYSFYGFQMQCMAFAGGHELIHGNAFKTKYINNFFAFLVGVAFFEVPRHERLMHKEHHIHTLNKYQDPELTSFYSRKELDSTKFMSVPSSRYSYFKSFVLTTSYLKTRLCRLLSCSFGVLTDYSGLGWSMTTSKDLFGKDIILDLQIHAVLQLAAYACIFSLFGRTLEGLCNLGFWWIFPNLVGYAFINFYRNAEHADCDFTTNQLLNTRTVESCRWIRWLLWETNYHCEHHCYPMVPFFNLPVLHELMNDHIKHNELKTFAGQNWALVKPGGWIDCQQKSM